MTRKWPYALYMAPHLDSTWHLPMAWERELVLVPSCQLRAVIGEKTPLNLYPLRTRKRVCIPVKEIQVRSDRSRGSP